MQSIKKPKSYTITIYDYYNAAEYVSCKLGRDIDDYDGRFAGKKVNHKVEFKCFTNWLHDELGATKGELFVFYRDYIVDIYEDWAKEIYQVFINEFCKKGKDSVTFEL